jgi:predicted ATPase/DNA-binding CsgD family transcriptional regulator
MASLGLGDDRGLDPVDRITGYLGTQRVLLVIDNCEHVLASVANTLDRLLRGSANISVLTTSREPLGVPGEVLWRVPPLSLFSELGQREPSAEAVLVSEGVRLFVERALEARPTFRLDAGNAPTLAAICNRLDGLPLAIELAAARVRTLSPERILDGLADRFRLLTGGARTAMARQQTLQASVEWSHHLLSEEERVLFRRLAAFSGGFSLDAAEAIGAGNSLERWEILGLLSGLVDKSLVAFDGERYRLLQTIRDFANAALLASGEANSVRDRHAAWFLDAAEAASMQLEREVRSEPVAALEADHDNLRAALEWSVVKEDDDLALRFVVALTFFWLVHGHFSEGLSWHRRILARISPEASSLRCKAVWGLGHLSLTCVELSRGLGLAELEEAMKLARELGDPALLARPLADQGVFQVYLVPDAAPATLEEAIAAARRSGDEWAVSQVLWWQAFYWVLVRNRFDLAEPILRDLDAIGRRAGNLNCIHWNDIIIGLAAWHQGRLADAREAMERARAGAYDCDDPLLEMHAVEWQTGVRIAQGDYDGASALALQTALRLTRSLDGCRQGFIEFGLAEIALARGDFAEAAHQSERTAPIIREIALPFKLEKLEAVCGRVALARGDLTAASAAFHTASDLAAQAGVPWMLVDAHHCRGLLARAEGNWADAEDWHHRALALEVEYGFRGVAAETLEALASLAAAGESHAEAARLFGAAGALREETGQTRWPLDQPAHDADIAALQMALGKGPSAALWKEGAALSLNEAAAYASRARGERKRPRSGWASLTPTELEVVALAAQGLTNAQIGQRLFISAGTARIHLSHIYAKLGIANRAQLAAEATARGATGPA